MAMQQKVVRTYPYGFKNTINRLSEALEEGYTVVSSNCLKSERGDTFVDYIVQKENEDIAELEEKYEEVLKELDSFKRSSEQYKALYDGECERYEENIIKMEKMFEERYNKKYEAKVMWLTNVMQEGQREINENLIEMASKLESEIIDRILEADSSATKQMLKEIIHKEFEYYRQAILLKTNGER